MNLIVCKVHLNNVKNSNGSNMKTITIPPILSHRGKRCKNKCIFEMEIETGIVVADLTILLNQFSLILLC